MTRTSMLKNALIAATLMTAAACAEDAAPTGGDKTIAPVLPATYDAATYGRGCGTPELDQAQIDAIDADTAARVQALKTRLGLDPATPIADVAAAGGSIPVYLHVIRNSAGGGAVTGTEELCP